MRLFYLGLIADVFLLCRHDELLALQHLHIQPRGKHRIYAKATACKKDKATPITDTLYPSITRNRSLNDNHTQTFKPEMSPYRSFTVDYLIYPIPRCDNRVEQNRPRSTKDRMN